MSHALVLIGGGMQASARLHKLVADATIVIAADSGLHHAAALGLKVDLLIGDLDSVDPRVRARYPRVNVDQHPRDKDALDLELALDAAAEHAPTRISVIGGLSGRLDQTLANITIVAARHRAEAPMTLDDGRHRVWPVASGESRMLGLAPGTPLSLLPLDLAVAVSLRGVRYPLTHATLTRATGRGVSNVALGSVAVSVHSGTLIVLVAPTSGQAAP